MHGKLPERPGPLLQFTTLLEILEELVDLPGARPLPLEPWSGSRRTNFDPRFRRAMGKAFQNYVTDLLFRLSQRPNCRTMRAMTENTPPNGDAPGVREAPHDFVGILKQLGPGLIIAGSVVGSGELIATTAAGAEAGFWLLWVILIACVIKVFVQLEVGKYSVISGRTALDALGALPGWKPRGLHWIAWMALLMFLGGVGQMGGVLGGVGQSLSIAVPVTEQGRTFNEAADARVRASLGGSDASIDGSAMRPGGETASVKSGYDVFLWSFLVAVATAVILFAGRYGLIEKLVTVFVVGFTFVSLLNFVLLQQEPFWAVSWGDFIQGLRFRLPPRVEGTYPLSTALAAFGIIGMAAGEIIFYPYWCLEKGYGRHVGPNDGSPQWTRRAQGWLRVMRWDAWCSMVVYTISTVAFYLLGAAVLGRAGLRPQGMDMIRTLSAMYEPVFGEFAVELFLFGAFAVLYSTFFVNNASSALVWSDAVFRMRGSKAATSRHAWRRGLCVALPLLAFVLFAVFPNPRAWIIFAGMTQTLMLPLLGAAAIWFRLAPETRPFRGGRFGDGLVWLSAAALLVAGGWLLLTLVFPGLKQIG